VKALDLFYLEKTEPVKSCLLALKAIILNYNNDFTPDWKYGLPCFLLQGKIFCYLWVDKKTQFPYISIAKGSKLDHPDLIQGNRKVFKLLMINPEEDIPVDKIHQIFDMAMDLYD